LAPPQPSPLAPGYKLDRYELLCPIAEGGMASVWIARQTGKHGFQKLVAIKTILPKYAADPSFQQMFLDEVRIASHIEHANVTQILDVGEQHGVTYLVMEYVDGDALSKVHRAAREKAALIPPGMVLRVMADVCGGLHAAHELQDADGKPLGVVHRDVSPQNVLVSTKGVAKLIDFGIATARDRITDDTNAGQLKGKVRYMAPEQALGREADRRADIWAVGAVLYHLLSGRAPFEGENEMKTLFLLTSGRPPVPMRGVFHPSIVAIVRRALSHAPDARFPTASAMQEAIEDAIKQAELGTTTAAIAQYLAQEVGGRAEKRKEAIALGISAAEARERYADIMRSNAEKSNGGGSASSARIVAEALTAKADRVASEEVTVSELPSSPSSPASRSATGQTLGSAAISIGVGAPRRGAKLVAGLAVAAAVGVLSFAAVRGFHVRQASPGAPVAGPLATAAARPAAAAPTDLPPPPPPVLDTPAQLPAPAPADSATAGAPQAPAPKPATAPRPAPARPVAVKPSAAHPPATPFVPRVNDGF
jgi:serine/threonine-protein kinase